MTDADLLKRYVPYVQYDSLESYRADSAAVLPEQFFDDGAGWRYTNVLKRQGGRVLAAAQPQQGQKRLHLFYLGGTRYGSGALVQRTDYLDAVGRRYVEDARRMHADPRYADRVYGHVAREPRGALWLQYWFFYYYNDKNFFGVGLHEGDWEMIQLRLGPDGAPTVATFAQHNTGQPLSWSALELRAAPEGSVPVVYVGRGSHASFARAGEHWPLPLPEPDYANGKGPSVRPKLEILADDRPRWVLWPGKWGSSDSSPRGPVDKQQWRDPGGFHLEVGGDLLRGLPEGVRLPRPRVLPAPPAPQLTVERVEDQAVVTYRFPQRLRSGVARPERLVVSVDPPDDDLPPATHAFTVRDRGGFVVHPFRLEDKRYVVQAVAYSEDGVESKMVSADVPAAP